MCIACCSLYFSAATPSFHSNSLCNGASSGRFASSSPFADRFPACSSSCIISTAFWGSALILDPSFHLYVIFDLLSDFHASPAVPGQTKPRLAKPHRASPSLPCLPYLTRPLQATPRHAIPSHACHTQPDPVSPCLTQSDPNEPSLALPRLPYHAVPFQTCPQLTSPCLACLTTPNIAPPVLAQPRLACRAGPGLTAPCQT